MDKNIENNCIPQPNSSVGYIQGVQDIIRQLQLTNLEVFLLQNRRRNGRGTDESTPIKRATREIVGGLVSY
jgi:hypothetical protein